MKYRVVAPFGIYRRGATVDDSQLGTRAGSYVRLGFLAPVRKRSKNYPAAHLSEADGEASSQIVTSST